MENKIEEKYSESFIHYEDDAGICSKCGGKKEFIESQYRTKYWKYSNTKKDCVHNWRKFTESE